MSIVLKTDLDGIAHDRKHEMCGDCGKKEHDAVAAHAWEMAANERQKAHEAVIDNKEISEAEKGGARLFLYELLTLKRIAAANLARLMGEGK